MSKRYISGEAPRVKQAKRCEFMAKTYSNVKSDGIDAISVLAPFKTHAWMRLSPAARLSRAWRLRKLIPNLRAIHDQKIFPRLDGE